MPSRRRILRANGGRRRQHSRRLFRMGRSAKLMQRRRHAGTMNVRKCGGMQLMAGATMSVDVTVVLKGDGISSVYDFRKNTKQIKTTFSSLLVPNLKNIKIIVTPLEKGVHFFATKKGGKMPTWYTRYFIYQPSTRVIRYYT